MPDREEHRVTHGGAAASFPMRWTMRSASDMPGNGRRHAAAGIFALLSLVVFVLVGCGGEPVPVHLGSLSAPAGQTFQSGSAATVVLPAGIQQPQATDITIAMTPAAGGSGYNLQVQSLSGAGNGTYLLTFTLPSLSITAPAQYLLTASGKTGTSSFDTSPPFSVTVQPGPALSAIAPATAQAGATLDVALTGISTAWVNGVTTASFGAGISVGGAAAGTPGPVNVTSGTQAVAHLVLSSAAAAGTRDVVVTSGTQQLTLPAGFRVSAAAPLANAGGPYSGTTGQAVSFSASGSSDPAGLALTYVWAFGDGSTGTGANPTHAYTAAGKYSAAVTATNSAGVSATASAAVTVADPPKPPVANAGGPYTGVAGAAVSFNASASTDPQGGSLTYAWNFGDGGTGTGATPVHTYAAAGTFSVGVTVTNTAGLSNTATATATIAEAPKPPVANAGGPYTGVAGTAVSFSGAGSTDPKGQALTYSWNFGDGGTGTGATPTHTYAAAGTYSISLTVTNTDNLSSTATATATIAEAPKPPVANAGGPYIGVAGTAVSFTGAGSSDPKGQTLTYSWNFGDGGTAASVSPTHTYAAAGAYTVTLTVKNTDNLSSTAAATATIAEAPRPPVANAGGPYTGVAGAAVSFSGAGSTDPKGQALTYAWNFGDGGTGTGATPTHTYAAAGTYSISLTVTNTDNLSSTATATATIAEAPKPPVANAGGPYNGVVGASVNFNGAGSSDPKGETLSYAWTFGDGGTATGATPAHTFASLGTYTVTLTVTNTDKLSSTANTTATITAAPQPPLANAGGPYTGVAGTAVTFSGAASSDPKGEALTYAWNFGDGGTATGATPTHTYASAGAYTVTLTATNTDGLTNTASTTATITAAPQPPVANAGGPYTGVAGAAVTLDGSGSSDPKAETLTYAWSFGDGGTANTAKPSHTYAAAGTYTVTLKVTNTDNLSNTASTTATITAAPQPPVANAGGPYTGIAGTAVTFSGTASSDPKGEALSYAWSFGDGATAVGVEPTHTYAAAGTYTVTLTVTNVDNLTATATATATIGAAPQAPVANAGGPYTGTAGTAVTFNGSSSSDPAGRPLSFAWSFGDGGTATGVSPAHTYVAAGSYTVSLTVTNTANLTATATTSATISAANVQKPVAAPGGPYTGTVGRSVSFNGTGSSDPSNPTAGPYALTFSWNFGDGSAGVGAAPVHTYSQAGLYNVGLTVQNASGASATASTTANIAATASLSNVPTAVPGGPYTSAAGVAVSFDGSASTDPGNAALTYHWSFGDGSSADGKTVTHAYPGAGTFSVQLTVFNGAVANSASTTSTITAPPVPALVVKAGGPYSVALNQPITLDGSQTNNPNSRQQTFAWSFGDNSTGDGAQATHIYTASGTYTATLTVSDATGTSGSATAQVTVGGPATESITASAGGPYSDITGHAITFDAGNSTDNLSKPLTYSWNFGDGATGSGVNATHAYAAKGTYTATVTATSGTASATATAQVKVTAALQVIITTPVANALFGTTTTSVSGTLSAPNLTVNVNGIAAQVSGTSFTATGVSLREGVNLISATATDGSGGVGTGSVAVVMDATAPRVTITSPADGAVLNTSTISVAGLVNDTVTGTVGSNEVSITVNGVPAQVSNRSFLRTGVLLAPGANTITATVTDKVGNTSKTTATVQYVPPSRQFSLNLFSGDAQTGAVHALLPQPLTVQLLSADGTPVAGRPVTFAVSRSDGAVEVLPTIGQSVYVNTDANGKASVLFQLGSRSGLGINQVTASTPGAAGTVLFEATSTIAVPAQIHATVGENQRGLLGEPLPEGFQVIVQDAYGNPVPGTTVTYTVKSGDGTMDHATQITDSNGKASASLTLGQQEGVGNYLVSADFAGDPGQPATFAASAYAPGPIADTRVSGVVLDNANMPVPNATIRILGTTLSTTSDTGGRFQINGAPVGTVTLSVDGSTSTRTETFPFLSFVLQDLPGQNNTLNKPVYLPKVDVDNAQTVGGDDPVTITMAGVPGVAFTVAPHSVTFPDGSTVGKLSVSQVKNDMVPMAPANGSAPDLIWTLQPAGARFSVPVQVTVPNTSGLAPGTVTEMFQYDHDLEQFVSAGTSHVSADGSVLVSDPGFGITKAGWGHGYTNPVPPDCIVSCDDHNECTTDKAEICGCSYKARDGAACGSNAPNSCQLPGVCIGASCSGIRKNPGAPCDDGLFCTKDDQCTASGSCVGTPKKDIAGLNSYLPDAIKFEKAFESGVGPLVLFLNNYGVGIKIEPVIVPEFNITRVCCEAKKTDDALKTQSKLTVGLKVSTDTLPIPGASYIVPGVGAVYVYIQVVVTVSGNVAFNTDACTDTNCVTGGVGLDGTIELGLKAEAVGFSVSGGGQAGITSNITVGCHAAIFAIGSTDAKAVFSIGAPNGRTYSFEKVIIPASNLGQALVSLR